MVLLIHFKIIELENLFDKKSFEKIQQRLNNLNSNSQRQWGTMNVAQMLTHCSIPIEYALADRVGKQSIIGKIFKPFIKNKFYDEVPYKQKLPTAPEFVIVEEKDFETEKKRLSDLLLRFEIEGKKSENSIHLFLGKISADEWSRTLYKHLDHHFRQFGV